MTDQPHGSPRKSGTLRRLLVGCSILAVFGLAVAATIAYFFGPEIVATARKAKDAVVDLLEAQRALQAAYPSEKVQVSINKSNGVTSIVVSFIN